MSKYTLEELENEYEALAGVYHLLFDRQAWTVVHMGGTYHRARVLLTDAEFEQLTLLSKPINDVLASMYTHSSGNEVQP